MQTQNVRWEQAELDKLFLQKLSFGDFSVKMLTRGTAAIHPKAIATAECRGDQSRIFVELNEENQVTGGCFG